MKAMNHRVISTLAVLFFAIMGKAQNTPEAYVLNANSQLEPMTRAVTSGMKTGGAGKLMFGGKLTTSIIIGGKTADLVLPVGATYFYIYNPKSINIKTWKVTALKTSKKGRELPYMKTGAFSGATSAIEEIELGYEKLSNEIYLLKPKQALDKGEYVLYRSEMGTPSEMYDFRIDPSISSSLTIPENNAVLAEFKRNNDDIRDSDADDDNSIMLASSATLSDVDRDIPIAKEKADNTFALIVANENYKQVDNVPFALNDGRVFKQYLQLSVGVPEKNIIHYEDASLSDIKYALNRLQAFCEAYSDAKVIVFYSGHGMPDEKSSEGYLLPADTYPSDMTTALKISDLYKSLSKLSSKSTVLFMDACFSGVQKSGEALVAARGVAIKVKDEIPMGNLVVFSAAQGDQTAYPYTEKQHGLMTYFLLKKLQEEKGNVKLGELSDYIKTNVKQVSVSENGKSQTPITTFDETNKDWWKQTLR